MASVLYVYAVTGEPALPECEAVDGSRRFGTTTMDQLCATFTPVDAAAFSQEVIDQRAGDLDWLGAIGYRHQEVMSELMKLTPLVPLRAFSLFSSEEALRSWLQANHGLLAKTLQRLGDRREWTLRIELDPAAWSEALTTRVQSLRDMQEEIAAATPGRAFLLKKKLDDEKKKASRTAENELVAEIEQAVLAKIGCETVAESRERRDGAFPQINVLLNRDEEAVLEGLRADLAERYAPEGVSLALSGPWPPYTFAGGAQ